MLFLDKVLRLAIIIFPLLVVTTDSFTLQRDGGFFRKSLKPYHGPKMNHVCLNMSSKPISSSAEVLYQKVVRPSNTLPELLFLGYLVEYLESHYELPKNLPMVYETLAGNEEKRSILSWDSPLSPSPEATRMEVEVIGIYTDDKKKRNESSSSQSTPPDMAMVVVKKAKTSNMGVPPMMQNLFQDSEKRILKALDRGLEDFIAGKIQFNTRDEMKSAIPKNVKTAEEAIEAELVDSIPDRKRSELDAKDVVFDTFATADQETNDKKKSTASPESVAAAKATMQVRAQSSKIKKTSTKDFAVEAAKKRRVTKASVKTNSKTVEDFAVTAAQKFADKKNKEKGATDSTPVDFAVAAAQKAAAVATKKSKSKTISTASRSKNSALKGDSAIIAKKHIEVADEESNTQSMPVPDNFKVPDFMGKDRAFRTTISRPSDRTRNGKSVSKSGKTPPGAKAAPTFKEPAPPSTNEKKETPLPKEKNNAESGVAEFISSMKKSIEKKRNLNVEILDEKESPDVPSPHSFDSSVNGLSNEAPPMPSNEQIEVDIMKAAQGVMSQMAEEGEEMTPEELLQNVLKFDEAQTKENEAGSGFVSGAFEKAKELLRERNQQRQARVQQTQFKEPNPIDTQPNLPVTAEEADELSAQEELRQMFEAGERLAEGRITESFQGSNNPDTKETTEEDIDELIARDKTISSYARSLDDELTELELSINKSPGEEFDGPQQNPMFDIMSGPEVYNPNVDADAINYPGAIPGTKDVKLPKELSEARKQAEFAVQVLTTMKTVETKDAQGNTETKFFSGEKELSQQQVENLLTVVTEATEIGLVNDPLNLMAERARLQMVVDELINQPRERFRDIFDNYKDLLLSDNFVPLVKERLENMADRDLDALRRNDESLREPHEREREILGQLVAYAQVLLKESRALGAELEAQQLEVVRSICKVAMDPAHQTQEEVSIALSDAVRDMRPLLDDVFVAYLKYAVAEEESRLARAGLLDDLEHNQWLFVLKIVQQGVYAEISKGINRYIEHIWYVLRMNTSNERKTLLSRLIDDMPTLDVRPFVQVVENIVGSLGDSTRGEFDGVTELGEMTNKLLQLHRDVKELLPPERIAKKSRDADEWAAKQKQRMIDARNLGKQRLQAANDVADRQGEIEAIGRRGEMERIE